MFKIKLSDKRKIFWSNLLYIIILIVPLTAWAKTDTVNPQHCTYQHQQFPLTYESNALHLELTQAVDCQINTTWHYPDILLIHGVTYSSHQFDLKYKDYSLVDYLAKHGMRVWVLDLAGFGLSQKPRDGFKVTSRYAAENISAAVNLIRQQEKVEKINLLGWSFGTVSTALMVAKYPKGINALILYAPIYHGMGITAPISDYQPFTDIAALSDFQKTSTNKQIMFSIAESKVVTQYLLQCRQYDGGGSANGCRKDFFQAKNITLFNPKAIPVPVLLIGGSKDPYIDWHKDIPLIMQELPNKKSKDIKIDGASHIMMLEKPYYHEFQQDILNFLMEN